MRDVIICELRRTPVGAFGGSLSSIPVHTLAATVVAAIVESTGIPGELVDEVMLGNCYPSMDAPALGRVAALDAGLPVSVTGLQLDRRCGSGLQAIIYAVTQVASGVSNLVIAGGAESMSNAPFYSTEQRRGAAGSGAYVFHDSIARGRVTAGGVNHPVPGGMLETAERLRRRFEISRQEQDEFALRSQHRAAEAQAAGRFDDEIVPVTVPTRRGGAHVNKDEHIRSDTTLEGLSRLRPILIRDDPSATVTAGNASGQNDGAAACVVTTSRRAAELGLRPVVRLVSWGLGGVHPGEMGLGPVPAVRNALASAGLELKDIDLVELNEAFAAQVLACLRAWGWNAPADLDRLNVNGSGISLGHPVGATGARILATLAGEMVRRGSVYGLEAMCIGGGQGLAAIFERVTD